jgi:hypothetical protein
LDLNFKTWEDRKNKLFNSKIKCRGPKKKDQNIDAKPNIKLETITRSLIRFTKKSLKSSCITIRYKSPFRQIPKTQDQKNQDTR